MLKFFIGVIVGVVVGLLCGAFYPNETRAQFRSVTDTTTSAIAKGAASAQIAADQQLNAPSSTTKK